MDNFELCSVLAQNSCASVAAYANRLGKTAPKFTGYNFLLYIYILHTYYIAALCNISEIPDTLSMIAYMTETDVKA